MLQVEPTYKEKIKKKIRSMFSYILPYVKHYVEMGKFYYNQEVLNSMNRV